jgi:hypothetical protein
MAPSAPTGRRGSLITRAAIAAALLCALGVGASPASAATKQVRYGGYAFRVPASWPVHDLAQRPTTCVRFDRHAVYLGSPGTEQRCPAHAVGRSEAILVEPQADAPKAQATPTVRARGGSARPAQLPGGPTASEASVEVPSAGVVVTATWRRHRDVVRRILDGAKLRQGRPMQVEPRAAAPAAPAPPRSTVSRAAFRKGLGFDACAAPSRSAMSAWLSSPYKAAGVYIGGANRGCSQPNLSRRWVRHETNAGWALMPIYVGLQAPGTSCNCATINSSQAKAQGRGAAADAITDARVLGMGPGSPIYFDMEYYARASSSIRTALRFLKGWTKGIHDHGYVSGVYSSGSAGISDLVSRYGSNYPEPDDIWIANWNGRATTDDPFVPGRFWSDHQRIHQFRGSHNERYGGHTINIDTNYLDGAVFGAADEDGDGAPDPLDLCNGAQGPVENSGCPYPSHVSGGLVDYLDSVSGDPREGDHFTTTGKVGAAYSFQSNLGFLLDRHLPGTVPLFSCDADHDQFLSRDKGCGGTKRLDTVGFAYAGKPAGTPAAAIYRCRAAGTGELRVTYGSDCNAPDTNEGLLGYTVSVASLGRYLSSAGGGPGKGDHRTTTAGVAPPYRFEANLGFLLTQEEPGTVPLYSCDAGGDQFLSRDGACGGAALLGTVGYAYARKPAGLPARAIYRCRGANSGELTVEYGSDCKAPDTNEGLLGYTISVAPLGRYRDSVEGDRHKGDHLTTTGGVDSAYHFQGNLGFVLTQRLAGTAPLYGCTSHRDQFLSHKSGCGRGKPRGLVGWIYSSAPSGTPSRAIYRCKRKNGERYVSGKRTCGHSAKKKGRRLGYAGLSPLPG